MRSNAPNKRVLLVLVLAITLATPLASVLPIHSLAQTGGQVGEVTGCEFELLNKPLFITNVTIQDQAQSPAGSMGFVETGDRVTFEVEIENRVHQDVCDDSIVLYKRDLTDQLRMRVTYFPDGPNGPPAPGYPNPVTNLGCPGNSNEIGPDEDCTVRISLLGDVVSGDEDGEQLVRFEVYDQDCGNGRSGPQGCPLAGAERVLVVDQLPDMDAEDLKWVAPKDPKERHTTYSSSESTFRVNVSNTGDYPAWNPNGGIDYWGRVSYDAPNGVPHYDTGVDDDDEVPDRFQAGDCERHTASGPDNDDSEDNSPGVNCETQYKFEDVSLPICSWTHDWDKQMICSYKRGDKLELSALYDVRRPRAQEPAESGSQVLEKASEESSQWDKDDAILPGETQPFSFVALDRDSRAGRYNLTVDLLLENEGEPAPEERATNNQIREVFDVLGVDLRISKHGLGVEGSGTPGLCTKEDPCPAGDTILLDPRVRNVGDSEEDYGNDNDLIDREWWAAIWIKRGSSSWQIATDEDGDQLTFDRTNVPRTSDSEMPLSGTLIRIPSDAEGGVHTVAIRLDHPDNYVERDIPPGPEGLVAERTESFDTGDCTLQLSEIDNAWCIELHFEDETVPVIHSMSTDPGPSEDGIVQVEEGEQVSFRATVTDNSLQNVEAVFETLDGEEANFTREDGTNFSNLTMELVDEEADTWEVNHTFSGNLGEYVFKVKAEDGQHTAISEDAVEFNITELTKGVHDVVLTINGNRTFSPDSAPPYRGSVAEPENTFDISAEITGTGHEDPNTTDGKFLRIYGPDETLHVRVPMGSETVCTVTPPGGTPTTGTRDQCEDSAANPNTISDVRERFYVDNTEQRWETNATLPFVGEMNFTFEVEDAFGRISFTNETGRINDQDGPPGLENATLAPRAVNPGQGISASGDASDALRIERVFLRTTKPSGDEAEFDMDLTEADDAATRTGTWSGQFASGAGGIFDQAGTYSVEMVALDFADKETVEAMPDVRVNDTDTPVIDEFFTSPPLEQEIGGNVTWEIAVSDSTAIQPPVLRVTRPTSGPTGPIEMTFNNDTQRWNTTLHADPVDEGVWTYEVEVSDYVDHVVSQAGEIEVKGNIAPQAQNWAPNVKGVGTVPWGPAEPTISAEIVDFGSGVNLSTIEILVDGTDVTGESTLTEIKNVCTGCYKLQHTPSSAFEDGDTVTVEISAEDNTEPDPLVATKIKHQFKVDAVAPQSTLEALPSVAREGERLIGVTSDLNVSVSDSGSGAGGATIEAVELAGTSPVPPAQELTFTGESESFRLQDLWDGFPGHGNYRVTVTPADAVGNEGEGLQQTYLFDQAPPKIDPLLTVGKPREQIAANVTDDSQVERVVVKFTADDSEEHTLPLENTGGDTWEGEIRNPDTDRPYPKNTTIEFFLEATDLFSNVATSPPDTFQSGDSVPTITIEEPGEDDELSGRTTVRWSASDAETDASELRISLYYRKSGEQFKAIPEAQNLRNVARYTLDTTVLPNGELTLQAIVFDGTNFGDDKVNVQVRNLGDIFTSPEIQGAQSIDGKNVVGAGSDVVFTVRASQETRAVWANITHNGSLVQAIELDDGGSGTWSKAFQAPEDPGDYSVDLTAVTDEGAETTEDAYTFTVQSASQDSKSFVPEWTILSILFAAAIGVGAVGLAQRWN